MKVYRSVAELIEFHNSVVTVGNFDGVHCGHLKIIERIVYMARRYNCRSVLITFEPHPQIVKPKKINSFGLLTPLKEKIKLLENTGINILLILPFDEKLSQMNAKTFIIKILKGKIKAKYIIIGFNHSFGNQRSGNVRVLQQLSDDYNFSVELVEPIKIKNNDDRLCCYFCHHYAKAGWGQSRALFNYGRQPQDNKQSALYSTGV